MPSQVKTDENNHRMQQTTQPMCSRFRHVEFFIARVLPKCFFESRTFPGKYFNVWPCNNQKDSKAIFKKIF